MRISLKTILTTAAVFVLPTVAIADSHRGSIKDAPVYSAPVNWSGFHIGMAIGYGSSDAELTRDLFLAPGVSPLFPAGITDRDVSSTEPDGVTGTITVGYDRMLGSKLLAGVFVDYTFGDMDDDGVAVEPLTGNVGYNVEVDGAWAVGGRLGYLIRPETLIYVNGGYTEVDINLSSNGTTIDEDSGGYFVGGGVAHHLRDGLTLTLDYRYSDYDSENFFNEQQFLGGVLCCSESIDIEADNHAIRFGLAYRFPSRRAVVHTPLK